MFALLTKADREQYFSGERRRIGLLLGSYTNADAVNVAGRACVADFG